MRRYSDYWDKFYIKKILPDYPSNFAKYCLKNFIKKNYNLLEIGTGNGRDAIYFSKHLKKVTAIDKSKKAIENINILKLQKNITNLELISCDVSRLKKILDNNHNYNFIYMRWFLQSINEKKQDDLLKLLYEIKNFNPIIAIETRTIKDSIKYFKNSKKISEYEYVVDGNHYRRLIEKNKFTVKLKDLGFKIIHSRESTNFSRLKAHYSNEKPSLVRYILKK